MQACSPHVRGVWCLNRGPEDKLVEALSQWLTEIDADERLAGDLNAAMCKLRCDMKIALVERAFQLASSGLFPTIRHVERFLSKEGYELVDQHLSAPSLREEIRRRIRDARKSGPVAGPPPPQ